MFERKNIYCLYKECSGDRRQLVLLAKKTGVINIDFLFEKSSEYDLEHIFSQEGGSIEDIHLFLSYLIKSWNIKKVLLLSLVNYNLRILSLGKASQVYEVFNTFGEKYPDSSKEESVKKKFFKI